jgi:hypothetical protein
MELKAQEIKTAEYGTGKAEAVDIMHDKLLKQGDPQDSQSVVINTLADQNTFE